jgi:hypothetical protein
MGDSLPRVRVDGTLTGEADKVSIDGSPTRDARRVRKSEPLRGSGLRGRVAASVNGDVFRIDPSSLHG